MTENYLQIMIESLEKKREILFVIHDICDKQEKMLAESTLDKDLFNDTMEEKGELIKKLDQLDEGFEKTYELVRQEVSENTKQYAEQISYMKQLVSSVVEEGVSIKAKETRLKAQVDKMFKKEYEALRQKRLSNKVSQGYYQAMNRINFIDPQLMDHKK